jgi:tRNA-intron endonuclease
LGEPGAGCTTYFRLPTPVPVMQPFMAVYTNEGVVVPMRSEADSLFNDGYGSREGGETLTLDPCETLYNMDRGKIALVDEEANVKLSFKEALRLFTVDDSSIWTRFIVYRDLRTRGFVAREVDEAADFIVYERGMYKKQPPSYHVKIISEGRPQKLDSILDDLKKAEERNRELKLAVVDRRGEVVYYGLSEKIF